MTGLSLLVALDGEERSTLRAISQPEI